MRGYKLKEDIIEAEIIETNELTPQITTTVGKIDANFADIEEKVKKLVADYEGVTRDNILSMDLKVIKAEKAYLNKAKAAIENERKRIKKQYLAPLNAFEARVKEIETLIDKPLDMLSECVSLHAQAARDAKRKHLEEVFFSFLEANALEAFSCNVTFEMIERKEWINASYNTRKAENEICDAVAAIMKEWQGLMGARKSLFCPDETERVFWRTLSLAEALKHDNEQRDTQSRIDILHESLGIEQVEQATESEVEDFTAGEIQTVEEATTEETSTYILTISATENQKSQLINALRDLGIHGTVRRA